MKRIRVTIPAWVLFLSLLLAIAPLALGFFMDNALRTGFLTQETYASYLNIYFVLGGPGLLISEIFNEAGHFTRTDLGGTGFALSIALFVLFNFLGWFLLVSTARRMAQLLRNRATSSDSES